MGPRKRDSLTVCVDARELDADLVVVDALARLALLVRRYGCELALENASAELTDLIELAGLDAVLGVAPVTPGSREPRC
jgi:anti-anti-sigma regulatory factor